MVKYVFLQIDTALKSHFFNIYIFIIVLIVLLSVYKIILKFIQISLLYYLPINGGWIDGFISSLWDYHEEKHNQLRPTFELSWHISFSCNAKRYTKHPLN